MNELHTIDVFPLKAINSTAYQMNFGAADLEA